MNARTPITFVLGLAAQALAQDATTIPIPSIEAGRPAAVASSAAAATAVAAAAAAGGSGGKQADAEGKMMKGPVDETDSYARWLIVGLLGLAVVIFIYRIIMLSLRHFRHLVSLTHDRQNFFREPSSLHSRFKEAVLYAPLFRRKHTTEMKVTSWWGLGIIPNRFQSLLLILIIAANTFYCLYTIPFSQGQDVYLKLLRNRAGVAATVNCIPLVLFASRNNPLIWALDVSFDSFNLFHRWFGRMVAIEAATHVISWALSKPSLAAVDKAITEQSTLMNAGAIAFVAMIVMPIQASSLLRHAFYETFLHLHQGLALTVFIGLYYHLKTLKEAVYIQAVIAFWAVERLLRFATLVYRNIGKTRTSATVEVLPGEAMRVTLHLARPWRMRAGQHLYLTIPSIGLWTSHPFSVAWSSEEPMVSFEMANSPQQQAHDLEKGVSSSISTDEILSVGGSHTVSAIVRARSGFTGSLLRKASAAPQGKITLSALVEGPYGQAKTMASYGTVLMIAGGIGITHSLPYVRSLVAGAAGHTVATRRVTLVWIIQSPEHLEWVRPWMTSVLAMEGRRETLRIEIFITRPRSAAEVRSPSSTVRMYAGRPVISEIVAREVQGAIGATAVTVCGPGSLGDSVRESVRELCPISEVDLLEESFTW